MKGLVLVVGGCCFCWGEREVVLSRGGGRERGALDAAVLVLRENDKKGLLLLI